MLPFAGYWLGREIYAYNQTMGITMMGGFMSWLWIIQAILIGVLFLGSNYYLWLGMERIPGAERFRAYIPCLLIVLALGLHGVGHAATMIASPRRGAARWAGTHHPFLGFLGVMSAKNTAVNLMILTTFLSSSSTGAPTAMPTVSWARTGMRSSGWPSPSPPRSSSFYGVYGYFVEAIVRIGFTVYQVVAVLGCIVVVMAIDIPMFKGARSTGTIRWGTIAPRSQYVLILLAVTFTWLMGLMGFARSGIRQHWHVYGVHAGPVARRRDAGARLRGQRDHGDDHPLPRPGHVHLLARRPRREGARQGHGASRACTPPPRRSAAEAGRR